MNKRYLGKLRKINILGNLWTRGIYDINEQYISRIIIKNISLGKL